jgi:RNA polymerase sigma-70 factor (ECF subfamily)
MPHDQLIVTMNMSASDRPAFEAIPAHSLKAGLAAGQEGKCDPCETSSGETAYEVVRNWVAIHGDYLFNLAHGQLRDRSAAEDAVQETLLAAFKSLSKFSGRSSERTWLVGILRHKIYDHLRRACRERALGLEAQPTSGDEAFDGALCWIHQIASESMLPSRRLELSEFREHLEKALGELPPRIAQVFRLYTIEECPSKDVCNLLDISESNLWVTLHRGRRLLKDKLYEWWHGSRLADHESIKLNGTLKPVPDKQSVETPN